MELAAHLAEAEDAVLLLRSRLRFVECSSRDNNLKPGAVDGDGVAWLFVLLQLYGDGCVHSGLDIDGEDVAE
jgi:hypothetical protein